MPHLEPKVSSWVGGSSIKLSGREPDPGCGQHGFEISENASRISNFWHRSSGCWQSMFHVWHRILGDYFRDVGEVPTWYRVSHLDKFNFQSYVHISNEFEPQRFLLSSQSVSFLSRIGCVRVNGMRSRACEQNLCEKTNTKRCVGFVHLNRVFTFDL